METQSENEWITQHYAWLFLQNKEGQADERTVINGIMTKNNTIKVSHAVLAVENESAIRVFLHDIGSFKALIKWESINTSGGLYNISLRTCGTTSNSLSKFKIDYRRYGIANLVALKKGLRAWRDPNVDIIMVTMPSQKEKFAYAFITTSDLHGAADPDTFKMPKPVRYNNIDCDVYLMTPEMEAEERRAWNETRK